MPLEFSRRTQRWIHSLPPLLGFLVRQSRPGEQVPLADILGAMWHHVKGSGLFDRAGRAPEDASAETPLPGYALAAG